MDRYVPSPYQQRIFDFIQHETQNGVVSAVAGSGKTTTLLMAIDRIPEDKRILFMAYNKHIEQELIAKSDPHPNLFIKTVHSFGFNALRNYNPRCIPNQTKYRKIFRDIIDYYNTNNEAKIAIYNFDKRHLTVANKIKKLISNSIITNFPEFTSEVIDLCNLGRLYNVDIDIKQKGVSLLQKLSKTHSIPSENKQAEIAWYLTKLGVYYTNDIDFTDMIYLPIVLDLEVEQFDFVFIDECQDISTCQRHLMEKAIKPNGGRFIAVGDPAQAIYGFAGADEESFQALLSEPNTVIMPLSITYRCSKPIVDFVRPLNDQIQHQEGNEEGNILKEYSYKHIQDGDMILCRQTFPLVSLCIKFLSEGKKAYIIGSDIGTSLSRMIKNAKKTGMEYTMQNVLRILYTELQTNIQKIMEAHGMTKDEANNDEYITMTKEKIMAIEVLGRGITNPDDVIKKINHIFSDNKKSGICLSTIHKAKGLENENVFILQPELLPSKKAVLDWQILQEKNLMYVAYTRAKKTLGFISDYDAFKGGEGKMNDYGNITVSKHIGRPNIKMKFDLKVIDKRKVNTPFGETLVYDMVDKNGNVVTKFGEINPRFLKNRREFVVDANSEVSFYAIIKSHGEFRGVKTTNIGKISKY